MSPFDISAKGLSQEIMFRLLGPVAIKANAAYEVLKDMPSLLKVIKVLDGVGHDRFFTKEDLISAMNELYFAMDLKIEQSTSINHSQKQIAKLANSTFVGMVYNTILSGLKVVRVINN